MSLALLSREGYFYYLVTKNHLVTKLMGEILVPPMHIEYLEHTRSRTCIRSEVAISNEVQRYNALVST